MARVKFAPLRIPMARRRQTLAVFMWIGSFFIFGPICTLIMIYLLFTKYFCIPAFYLAWYIADRNTPQIGGRRWEWVRKWKIWKDYAAYFPVELVKESDLDPSYNYILGSHPHGILCSGAFCNFFTEGTSVSKIFPNITFSLTTLNLQFFMPFYRELFMTGGAISASRKSINFILNKYPGGHAIVLMVGGASESLDTHPNVAHINLVLKNRKGFVKLALKNGAHLVPSFSFGENDVYDQVNNPKGSKLREWQDYLQKAFGLAPVLLKGRGIFQYSFGIVPYRRPITTVVGEPIPVERSANPTSEEIDSLHTKYIDSLISLFERHKCKYYGENTNIQLKIT